MCIASFNTHFIIQHNKNLLWLPSSTIIAKLTSFFTQLCYTFFTSSTTIDVILLFNILSASNISFISKIWCNRTNYEKKTWNEEWLRKIDNNVIPNHIASKIFSSYERAYMDNSFVSVEFVLISRIWMDKLKIHD